MKQRLLLYESGRLRTLAVDAPGAIRWAAWSPDGDSALLVGDRGSLTELRGGVFRRIESATGQNLRCVEFHPAGESAYACGNGGTILRLEGGVVTPIRHDRRTTLRRVAWDPTGSRALLAGNNGEAFLLGLGGMESRVSGAETHLRSVAWQPKRETAIVAGNCFRDSIGGLTPSPNLFELKRETLQELSDLEASRADLTCASWRPDGSECLIVGFDQTWHTSVLLSYSPGGLRELGWGTARLFPTACEWNPSGSYALLGTAALSADEGGTFLLRYEGDRLSEVSDLGGYGVSCIAWRDEEEALVICSRAARAFSA